MYRIVLPILKAKGMPGSVKKNYEIILSGYELADHKETDRL
jgi:hypothetical protein